jgi:hypothetical protein
MFRFLFGALFLALILLAGNLTAWAQVEPAATVTPVATIGRKPSTLPSRSR